ncbi:FIST N-terminal domain-containing protein [Gallaecimonas mangrovi]|uniref:FIST N-terminal domain-containing protein n=1 Tax=Gallaecimonas mangrovi TaxID=2291597 RepID=UPI00186760EA|nr:FIST N-terminal domain-containing protein [Gallaecimonas mangrovi]
MHGARWGLLFASGFHQPQWLFSECRRLLGDIPLVGGSCCGIITPAGVEYGGFEAMLMLFDSEPDYRSFTHADINQLPAWLGQDHGLCFIDLLGELHLDEKALAGSQLHGGALIGDLAMSSSFIFVGDQVVTNQLVVAKLPKPTRSQVFHTALPISDTATITGAKGQQILTLNGEPALDRLCAVTGLCAQELHGATLHSLAVGLPWGDSYSSHCLVGVDTNTGSLTLLTGQLEVGSKAVLITKVIEQGDSPTINLLHDFVANRPSFYINCASRTGAFSGALEEESDAIRKPLGKGLAGIFTAAELISNAKGPRLMNWSSEVMQW